MKLVPIPRIDRRILAGGAVMLWVALSPWIWGFAGSRAAVAIRHAKTVAALYLSESTYRRLAESTPASVLVTSRDSDTRYINDFFMNYVGMDRDELAEQGSAAFVGRPVGRAGGKPVAGAFAIACDPEHRR